MNEESMILPEGFEVPAGEQISNESALPEAGLDMGELGGGNTNPEAQEQVRFKVKFNHAEQELGMDEAVPLIQKGMNYDRLQERFDSFQKDPRLGKYDKVTEVSKLLGYQTDDELLDALFSTYYENTANQQGLTVEQVRKDAELRQRENAFNQKAEAAAAAKAENGMYEKFLVAYPSIKTTDIKPETWALVKQGVDLTTAYTQQRNQDLEAQMKTMKQNLKNVKAAPGTGVTAHGSAEAAVQDPFLMGFNSI